jgi:hypothetical protein
LAVASVAAAPSMASAQAALGCTFVVKVVSESRILLGCGADWPNAPGDWSFTLWHYADGWERDPKTLIQSKGTVRQTPLSTPDRALRLDFAPGSLVDNATYRLIITAPAQADPAILAFSTAAEAEIVLQDNRNQAMVQGVVGFDPAPCSPCVLTEEITPARLRPDGTKTTPVIVSHTVSVGRIVNDDLAAVGRAALTVDGGGLSDGASTVRFNGLKNVLGAAVAAKGDVGSLDRASSAAYSIEVGLQAADGSRPSYSLDASLQPTLASWGQSEWRALAELDLGHNDEQSANSLHVGSDLLLPFRQVNWGPIFGVKPATKVMYETDKDGDSRNVIGAAETLIRLKGLYNPRDVHRKAVAVRLSVRERKPIKVQAVEPFKLGYAVPVKAGFDFGGSIRERTAGSDAAQVQIGKFSVARLRVGAVPVVEYRRLTFTNDLTVRWLLSDELVLDESGEAPVVNVVNGVKAYNELSILTQLDAAGHFALGVTIKIGSPPPEFNSVRSLAVRVAIVF